MNAFLKMALASVEVGDHFVRARKRRWCFLCFEEAEGENVQRCGRQGADSNDGGESGVCRRRHHADHQIDIPGLALFGNEAAKRLIGVVCKAVDADDTIREIESYDTDRFAELSGPVDRDGTIWAFIDRWATADEIDRRPAAWSDVASDIDALRRDPKLTDTVRQSLIESRLGQGGFRERVLAHWGRACALTGCSFEPLLRASHIKPWRHSDNDERLSARNGLPLAAHVDVLFDRGFISFADDGELLASASLPEEARALIGGHARLRAALDSQQRAFLAHHRTELFRS
ncbi:HNH endonuclease [Paraburkholderia sediminicola]|uniref:HNH endonuclease n=1 Tax=Paraburkholderia sediminicola TaxID=458836 RepID=UPI0038B7FC2B